MGNNLKKSFSFFSKSIIAALVVLVVGLVLIITQKLKDIGAVLLVSGVYTIIDNMFLKQSLVDLVVDKVNLDKDIDDAGLLKLDNGVSSIPYKEYLEDAKKCIDIVHNYGRTWTTNNIDYIKKSVLEEECRVRVVLLNPNSPFVPALEKHYSYKEDSLVARIEEVVEIWKSLYEEVELKKNNIRKKNKSSYKNKKCGNVELYYFNGQPTNSLYRIDDRVVVVTAKNSKEKSSYLPYAIYQKKPMDGLFNVYVNEIESIIKEATPVELGRGGKVEVR